jgi:hypothetical protein
MGSLHKSKLGLGIKYEVMFKAPKRIAYQVLRRENGILQVWMGGLVH